MGYGIRVVLVMNRKGGSGKSTLCRALASAAAARGETVTIFDTDASKSVSLRRGPSFCFEDFRVCPTLCPSIDTDPKLRSFL